MSKQGSRVRTNMGKTLDALLGRTFKTSKFKSLINLAISRLAVLKNQRQVRLSQDQSDVVQLLKLGHQDRALLRVDLVIKEQSTLDVFVMIEGYCNLLIERVVLIENNKGCPDELKEAISSLIFAASRCGEFPELQEIRSVFLSRYGKEFVAQASELRNGCAVNRKMMQKLATRQPSLESRLKVLKEIASEIGVTLHLEEESSVIMEEELGMNQKQKQPGPNPSANLDNAMLEDDIPNLTEEIDWDDQISESVRARKYRDVASAAKAAFESAAYAAAAARAAVELSQSESQDNDFDDQGSPTPRWRNISNADRFSRSRLGTPAELSQSESQGNDFDDQGSPTPRWRNRSNGDRSSRSRLGTPAGIAASGEVDHLTGGLGFGKRHAIDFSSESEGEELPQNHDKIYPEGLKESRNKIELERSLSASSSDSAGDTLKESKMSSNALGQTKLSQELVFDKSDDETWFEQSRIPLSMHHDLGVGGKSSLSTNEFLKTRQSNQDRSKSLNIEKRPISVRNRRGLGH